MEYQKIINLLDKIPNPRSKFKTKTQAMYGKIIKLDLKLQC